MNTREYAKIVQKNVPQSHTALNCLRAFAIGGGICAAGQGILQLFQLWGADELTARILTSVTLIFIGVLLTAVGVYDKLMANMEECRRRGVIFGASVTVTTMFAIAGPVLVYGISAAVLYGAVLWTLHLFGITLF